MHIGSETSLIMPVRAPHAHPLDTSAWVGSHADHRVSVACLSLSPLQEQPESPLVGAMKGFWRSTSNLTVQVANATTSAITAPFAGLVSVDTVDSHPVDVDAAWSKPFSTGSPVKKAADLAASSSTDDEPSEFSVNFWCARPPIVATPPPSRAHRRMCARCVQAYAAAVC